MFYSFGTSKKIYISPNTRPKFLLQSHEICSMTANFIISRHSCQLHCFLILMSFICIRHHQNVIKSSYVVILVLLDIMRNEKNSDLFPEKSFCCNFYHFKNMFSPKVDVDSYLLSIMMFYPCSSIIFSVI